MTDPTMTRERLDELEALEKAATPDIWGPGDMFPLFLYPKYGDDIGKFYRSEDTEFIAALRNDAPALIALARQALDAKAAPTPDPRDAAMKLALEALKVGEAWTKEYLSAVEQEGLWPEVERVKKGLEVIRTALVELDAAMKPQEPT